MNLSLTTNYSLLYYPNLCAKEYTDTSCEIVFKGKVCLDMPEFESTPEVDTRNNAVEIYD